MLNHALGEEPIPGYKLVRFLGEGQFGQVWESTSPGGGAAALKFLDLSGKQGWKEFRAIQKVKRIRHANLMPITALWLLDSAGTILDDDHLRTAIDDPPLDQTVIPTPTVESTPRWLVVAQLLGDGTLDEELKKYQKLGKDGIPVEPLLAYMEEAAKGIDFLNSKQHDLGDGVMAIQHCDIKPANILLLGGSALVCDFGVAQVLSDEENVRGTSMKGSPAYMPPECATGAPSSTSDQYSLAVSYYELRTGELPFEEQTYMAVLDAHRTGNLKLDHLPKAERQVIRKATSVDPKKRYADCQTMVRVLRQTVQGQARTSMQWTRMLGTSVLCGVLLAGAISYVQSTWKQTYQITVSPPDSILMVDGQRESLDDGTAIFKRKPQGKVKVQASHGSEYDVVDLEVDLEVPENHELQIRLEHSASYLASQAIQMARNDLEAAVQKYAEAIAKDSELARFPRPQSINRDNPTSGDLLLPIGCSRDGRFLVSVAAGEIHSWEISQDAVSTVPQVLRQHEHSIRGFAVGMSHVAATAGREVAVADLSASGEQGIRRCTMNSEIDVVTFGDEGRALVMGDAEGGLHSWNFSDTSAEPVFLGQHNDFLDSIVPSPSSPIFFTDCLDETVGRWQIHQPMASKWKPFIRANHAIGAIAVTGGFVAIADRADVRLSSDASPDFETVMSDLPAAVNLLAFDASGSLLAIGGDDGTVAVLRREGASQWRPVPLPSHHKGPINALVFWDSTRLITISNDKDVVVWDVAAQRAFPILQCESAPFGLCISPDQRWLFCETRDGKILCWNLHLIDLIRRAAAKESITPQPPVPGPRIVEA